MAVAAGAATGIRESPPDVMGPSAPVPRAIFWSGVAALVMVGGGVVAVQLYYAVEGGSLTQACIEGGITRDLFGARGVCNIVTALNAPVTSFLLYVGIALGAAAILAGWVLYGRQDTRRKKEHCVTGAILGVQAVVLGAFLLWFRASDPYTFAFQFLNFERIQGFWGGFLRAAANTLILAFTGELGGIVVGLVLSLLALSTRRAVRAPARAYINFFRGTPLIWQLSFFYFGLNLGLGLGLSGYVTAILIFMLNTGAYAAEVFRAGIQSIERGQMEAARSLGMSYPSALRYAIVPQAVRRVIPPLMNEFVILIKDTSLIIVLGLTATELDLYNYAREGYADTFNATFFVVVALGYLVVTLPLIRLVNMAERKLRSGLVSIAGVPT
jgi:His/Glu/Gln/Arg/opine family amino acid ABC transporter permease subunit